MKNTTNFDEDQKQELIHDISNALNYVGAYKALHNLLVDRYEGTPDFKTREEAREWWEKNDGRPSSIIIEQVTFNTDES